MLWLDVLQGKWGNIVLFLFLSVPPLLVCFFFPLWAGAIVISCPPSRRSLKLS